MLVNTHERHTLLQSAKWRLSALSALEGRTKSCTKFFIGFSIVSSLRVHELPALPSVGLILLDCNLEIVRDPLIDRHDACIAEPKTFRWAV